MATTAGLDDNTGRPRRIAASFKRLYQRIRRKVPQAVALTTNAEWRLPTDVIRLVLEASATDGSLTDTWRPVCKFFHEEIRRYHPRTAFWDHHVDCIEQILVRVDTTYRNGEWLKFTFCWRQDDPGDKSRPLIVFTVNAQDLSDKALNTWFSMVPRRINKVYIDIVAPAIPPRSPWDIA